MTENINAALAEIHLMQSEFEGCQRYLADEDMHYPENAYEKKRVLLRMAALLAGMHHLEQGIKADLLTVPIQLFPFNKTAHDEV
ncbi:hypothetical protein IDJ77_11370 [Mucilaginibacter sp. ZT4R22]|uniref:Uncharacterized protein n=1 Tax=Mucilaginibacter pankratovii TaxID=2772110 RepID=A0ABR7WQ13_9SPHI|nr:hypothetical protein [Mucilaginibacter pankratovii]MBD1364409.1 hypothetical protein [Mucilaginibacter pankratovii]